MMCFVVEDRPALWMWLSDILPDFSNETLVLDCVVLPVVDAACEAASLALRAAAEESTEQIIRIYQVHLC